MKIGAIMTVLCMSMQLAAEITLPAKAVIVSDFVKVRSMPSTQGEYVSILYRNMPVVALEKSENSDSVGGKNDYWYKITLNTTVGWVFGSFIDFSAQTKVPETYRSDLGTDWFLKRFAVSTFEYPELINLSSFTLEEYRSLITSIMDSNENSYQTSYGLFYSVYNNPAELEKKGDQPPYPYLRSKLYSPEFLAIFPYQPAFEILNNLPAKMKDDENFFLKFYKISSEYVYIRPEVLSPRLNSNLQFLAKIMIMKPRTMCYFSDIATNEKMVKSLLREIWVQLDKNSKTFTEKKDEILSCVSTVVTVSESLKNFDPAVK